MSLIADPRFRKNQHLLPHLPDPEYVRAHYSEFVDFADQANWPELLEYVGTMVPPVGQTLGNEEELGLLSHIYYGKATATTPRFMEYFLNRGVIPTKELLIRAIRAGDVLTVRRFLPLVSLSDDDLIDVFVAPIDAASGNSYSPHPNYEETTLAMLEDLT